MIRRPKIRKAQCTGEKFKWVVGTGCYELVEQSKKTPPQKIEGTRRPKIRKADCTGEKYEWVVGSGCYELSRPKKTISKDMEMYISIERYFEMADVPTLTLDNLKKFREEIIEKSGILKARLVVDWKSVIKAFKSVGKKFGLDVKKFNEITRDLILIRLTNDLIGEKDIIY